MERIPVTHAGSLIRPPELLSFLAAKDHGAPCDEAAAALAVAVADVVRTQVETGIDIVDDGEMGKSNWITYPYERAAGTSARLGADPAGQAGVPRRGRADRLPGTMGHKSTCVMKVN